MNEKRHRDGNEIAAVEVRMPAAGKSRARLKGGQAAVLRSKDPSRKVSQATRTAPKPEPHSAEGVPGSTAANFQPIANLEQRAAIGDGAAACSLCEHYRTGDLVPQDLSAAFNWYGRGAALGNREAQNNFGTMFLQGFGCEVDQVAAVHWYRQSAEQGCADAQWNLAKRYLRGEGIQQDYAEAYAWFAKAAVQGYTDASCDMGTMHRFGQGVTRNLLAAADFHLIAATAGDEVACHNLSAYRKDLQEMALSGSQMASLFLCRMYNQGFGAESSQSMTWTWISWAKEHCSVESDAEIAQEVSESYDFYRQVITKENRTQGDRTLAELRAAHDKRSNKPHSPKRRCAPQRRRKD